MSSYIQVYSINPFLYCLLVDLPESEAAELQNELEVLNTMDHEVGLSYAFL